MVTDSLKPLQAKVQEAENGRDGLHKIKRGNFDLVIADYQAQEINGTKLCRKMKQSSYTQRIPVIMLSSFNSEEEINQGFESGAAAYISKDDIHHDLLPAARKVLFEAKISGKRRILVVDDSRSIRKMVVAGLEMAGFDVVQAENGRRGLEYLQQEQPDIILSDIDMPEMNGFEFCKAISRNQSLVSIPIIIMSSNDDRTSMNRMASHGVSGYLIKPFNINQLVLLVEKTLSDQHRILLQKQEQLTNEKQLLLSSISSLITALEARDTYTRGHSENVAHIVSGMMTFCGGSTDDVEGIALAGRLHDIGKIGVRDSVLLKPGKLTGEEYDQIKQHTLMGAIILKPIESLGKVAQVVQSHHEHIDGKGYPGGLKGEQIPLWARMTAVADVYDALTSDRPYRKGMPLEKALEIIDKSKGSQLCPDSVDLFHGWLQGQEKDT